jgi:methyltransferase-like protein/SAM-dependent methyltransferase
MSDQPAHTSYDELPYPSHPYPQTHPDHLATIATLLGMKPAPADRCRVLELGCAGGGNLIPLALALPESTFVGVDLSAGQIAEGQKNVDALGLKNVQLRQMSIMDVDDGFGTFDYIVCHGVYSWVPTEVQDKLLATYRDRLAPEGVGYLSYNTYPGWHMRGTIRAIIGLHDQRFRDQPALVRVAQARALLAFLTDSVGSETSYGQLLRENVDVLQRCTDSYLFHEHLEECNAPIYFTEMCDRLAAHKLRYLGESEFRVMVPSTSFAPIVQQQLAQVAPGLIEREQYMDLLRNRLFRQTLIGHDHIRPSYDVRAEQMFSFQVASPARTAASEPDIRSDAPAEFKGRGDLALTSSTPVVKAAFVCLGETWPRPVAFDTLLASAQARLKADSADGYAGSAHDGHDLAKALLTAYATAGEALVELWLRPPPFATSVSAHPVASPLARLQAVAGPLVTNYRHEAVALIEFDRQLLPHLDGSHDRAALLQVMLEKVKEGSLRLSEGDEPVTDPGRAEEILAEVLDKELPGLAQQALLIA